MTNREKAELTRGLRQRAGETTAGHELNGKTITGGEDRDPSTGAPLIATGNYLLAFIMLI